MPSKYYSSSSKKSTREAILSKPTAVQQLGGYYSTGTFNANTGTKATEIGFQTVGGKTQTLATQTQPYIALSPAFAEKASTAGVSVSITPDLKAVQVTPPQLLTGTIQPVLPTYAYTPTGEQEGIVRTENGKIVYANPLDSAIITPEGNIITTKPSTTNITPQATEKNNNLLIAGIIILLLLGGRK